MPLSQERLLPLVVVLNGTHQRRVKMRRWVIFVKNQLKRTRAALVARLKEALPSSLEAMHRKRILVLLMRPLLNRNVIKEKDRSRKKEILIYALTNTVAIEEVGKVVVAVTVTVDSTVVATVVVVTVMLDSPVRATVVEEVVTAMVNAADSAVLATAVTVEAVIVVERAVVAVVVLRMAKDQEKEKRRKPTPRPLVPSEVTNQLKSDLLDNQNIQANYD